MFNKRRKAQALRRRKHALPPPKTYGVVVRNGRLVEGLRPDKGRAEDPEETFERAMRELHDIQGGEL